MERKVSVRISEGVMPIVRAHAKAKELSLADALEDLVIRGARRQRSINKYSAKKFYARESVPPVPKSKPEEERER